MSVPLVLLVDSHDDSRAIYTTILRHAGFAVTVAACPDEGLRAARAELPDLIVLEVCPPRARGLNAVRGFRYDAVTGGVPLVTLSTIPTEDERRALMAEGVAAYLVKPCPPLELLTEARRVLGR